MLYIADIFEIFCMFLFMQTHSEMLDHISNMARTCDSDSDILETVEKADFVDLVSLFIQTEQTKLV